MSFGRIARKLRKTTLLGGAWAWLRPAYLSMHRSLKPRGREVLLNDSIRLRVDPEVYLSHASRPTYEPEFFEAFLAQIAPDSVVYDVGANQGLFTIAAAQRLDKGGKVFAFECAPASLRILRRQIELNEARSRVEIIAKLVGEKSGEAVFHAAPHAAGWATAVRANGVTSPIKVESTSLDRFSENHQPPSVIKIDTEGYELNILKGAESLLNKYSPTVFCAVHPELLKELRQSPDDLLSYMESRGYKAQRVGKPEPNGNCEFQFSKTHGK